MEDRVNNDIVENLKNTAFWKRLLFMVLFGIVYIVAKLAICAVILFLILFNLFMGSSNERAVVFGKQISAYIYHILLYLTYNTEERPFPFSDWPGPGNRTPSEGPAATDESENNEAAKAE